MKYECPLCKANLIHTRINDGKIISELYSFESEIKKNIILDESHGEDIVECSKDKKHEIPIDLQMKTIELVEWMG